MKIQPCRDSTARAPQRQYHDSPSDLTRSNAAGTEQCLQKRLDRIYRLYHRRKYIHPDPLEFLYGYEDLRDREIAGLVASALAYGRVVQILKSVSCALGVMRPSPYRFLRRSGFRSIRKSLEGFYHRFATGEHVAVLLRSMRRIIEEYGSLHEAFVCGMSSEDETVLPAMTLFAGRLRESGGDPGHLVPDPAKGSACKRLNLFLRWMVRKDRIDPGGWDLISPDKLIVPLDIHIHRISLGLGLTARRHANMRTALEVTRGFKRIEPHDPLKYDFSLTRLGIRSDLSVQEL